MFDHVGIAGQDLEALIALYRQGFGGRVEERLELDEQGVALAVMDGGRLELLAPLHDESPISKFLEERGPGLHHLAFRVRDLDEAVRKAEAAGMEVIEEEPRTGYDGRRILFLHPKSAGGVLIELCEGES